MTSWQPSNVFAAHKTLRLSQKDIAKIQEKLPAAENGKFYTDAVFEGGGVKGTAFLGALRCFNDAGITFRKVAGTSAGAITAAMIVTGFDQQGQLDLDKLENSLSKLNYNSLLRKKTSPFIFNGSPNDDLQNPVLMLLNLLLVGKKGQYSSEPFLDWLQGEIGAHTFEPFQHDPEKPWYEQRELQVVISDISQKAMRVLPTELSEYGNSETLLKTFRVAEAVRLSMSIPFFFEPGKLGESTIVDGGILSNFPLWIYDAPQSQRPYCPTFGFRLVDSPKTEITQSAVTLFKDMLSTMQAAGDRRYMEKNDQGRVINIDLGKLPQELQVSTTQFNLTNQHKDALYKLGYETAKEFLLEKWDWNRHLKARGYDVMKPRNKAEIMAQKVQKSELIAA